MFSLNVRGKFFLVPLYINTNLAKRIVSLLQGKIICPSQLLTFSFLPLDLSDSRLNCDSLYYYFSNT